MNVQVNFDEKALIEELRLMVGESYILYELAKSSGHIDPEGFAQTTLKLLISGCPKDEDI